MADLRIFVINAFMLVFINDKSSYTHFLNLSFINHSDIQKSSYDVIFR